MQDTQSSRGRQRPIVRVLLTGVLAASALWTSTAFAQAGPPVPPRAGGAPDPGARRAPLPPQGRARVAPGQRPGMASDMGGGAGGRRRIGAGAMGPRDMGRRGERGAASTYLRMRQQLGLTEDQVTRLEALQSAAPPPRNESDMLRARADLMDATRGDGNISAARAALDRMSRITNDETLAGLKNRQDTRNVLTAAQKSRVDKMRDNMRGEARGRMREGMRRGKQRGTLRYEEN